MKQLLLLLSIILFSQCEYSIDLDLTPVSALAPIYVKLEVGDVVSENVRETTNIGQIVFYKSYILILESNTGIHVIDNEDVLIPAYINFLNLPGLTSFHVKDDSIIALFANHIINISIIDIQNSMITAILELEPSPNGTGNHPNDQNYSGKFECVDLSKGIVTGWEMKNIIDPRCSIFN